MKKLMLSLLAVLLFLPNMAQAATFKAGDDVHIDSVISEDFYGAADLINITNDVRGDLYAAGSQVIIDGNVSQDMTIAAGNTVIKGEIADDLRVATGTLSISGVIKGDVLAATGTLTIDENSFIGGDLYAASGQILLDGDVNGDVKLAGDKDGSLRINSLISGSLTVIGFEHITFGPEAKVAGNFTYRAVEPIEIPEGIVLGELSFKQIKTEIQRESILPAVMAGFSLFKLLSLLFFGLFLIWLFKFFAVNAVDYAHENTLKSLGIGFLVLILTPIVAIVLAVTAIGLPMAAVLMGIWFIALCIAKIMASILIGFRIIRINNKSGFGRMYGAFVIGALIYTIIGLVPFVGWLINATLVLIALGAMIVCKKEIYEQLRKKKLC